ARFDPNGEFVSQYDFVPNAEVVGFLERADIFIFASSCENLPITLLEGMAAGLPIACSNRGPMPEVLGDGGLYFDPEDTASIGASIRSFLVNRGVCDQVRVRAAARASQFTWKRCADQTWQVLSQVSPRSHE